MPRARIANHADAAAVTKAQLAQSVMEAKALVAIQARVSDLDLLVRHVRGHTRGQQRQEVNRMCDAEARRHMLAERAKFQRRHRRPKTRSRRHHQARPIPDAKVPS